MPENIFISYARTDGETHAQKFNTDLKALEYETWFDKDKDGGIQAGLAWQKAIQQGIDDCTVFVLVMTPASIQSNNCFAEWSRAMNQGKPILPLRMQPTDTSKPVDYDQLPLYIETLQYIDFVADFDAGWEELTHRLKQLDEENFKKRQDQARESHRILPAFAKGYLLTNPDDVPRLAEKFVGRETFKTQIEALLEHDKTVLLHGFGGVGKSAFASELTADKLANDNQPILWVEVGNAPIEGVFSAIGQVFGQQKEMILAKTDDEKIKLTRDLIRTHNIAQVVIDDAWNPAALTSLLKTLPRRKPIPVLITSRQRHIITGEMHPVDSLLPDDALTLLTFHMANNTKHEGADDLCQAVGYHPFMLEIAGKLLLQRDISPKRLLDDMDKTDLPNLSLPEGVAEVGRENMAKLLLQSLNALPDDLTRAVFLAFGAFPTPIASPEMLALYLNDDIEAMNREFFDTKYDDNPIPIHELSNLPQIEKSLNTLHQHGLVRRIPSETRDSYPYSIETYRVHDLAHAYGGGQNPDLSRMVSACLAYTWRHNQPNYVNFSALRPELENLVGASGQAMIQKRWQDAEQFAWNLYRGSQFTDYQGYYTESQTLLSQAAQAAEQRGDKQAQGGHLGNLGIAYDSLADYPTAIDYYQQILVIHRDIGDKKGEGSDLGNLGVAYNSLGDYETAIDYHKQALEISRDIGDNSAVGSILGNLGIAYNSLGDYQTAIDYHKQALELNHSIGNRKTEGDNLGSLGIAYHSLGDTHTAIDYYQQQLTIVEEIGNKRGKGTALGNLGLAYHSLGDYQMAIDYHKQALEISRDIGDKKGKGNVLGNLGLAYKSLGEREKALDYYQQSIAIQREIGDRQGVAIQSYNMGTLMNDLGRYAEAIPLLEESVALTKQMGQMHYLENRERELERARKGLAGGS
jgi:tetratricopeptide (TPR) repeat protein